MDKAKPLNIMDKGRVAPDDESVVGMNADGEPAGEVARITIIVKDESWNRFGIENNCSHIPEDVLPTFLRKVAKTIEGSILGQIQ